MGNRVAHKDNSIITRRRWWQLLVLLIVESQGRPVGEPLLQPLGVFLNPRCFWSTGAGWWRIWCGHGDRWGGGQRLRGGLPVRNDCKSSQKEWDNQQVFLLHRRPRQKYVLCYRSHN